MILVLARILSGWFFCIMLIFLPLTVQSETHYSAYKMEKKKGFYKCFFRVQETDEYCHVNLKCRDGKSHSVTYFRGDKLNILGRRSEDNKDYLKLSVPDDVYPVLCRGLKGVSALANEEKKTRVIKIINTPRLFELWREAGQSYSPNNVNFKVDEVSLIPASTHQEESWYAKPYYQNPDQLVLIKGLDLEMLLHLSSNKIHYRPRIYQVQPQQKVKNPGNYDKDSGVICGRLLADYNIYNRSAKNYHMRWFHPDKKTGIDMETAVVNNCLNGGLDNYSYWKVIAWKSYITPVRWRLKNTKEWQGPKINSLSDESPLSLLAILTTILLERFLLL